MEGLIATIVLVLIAIPISIIYLLVQLKSLKGTLKHLKNKIDTLENTARSYEANNQANTQENTQAKNSLKPEPSSPSTTNKDNVSPLIEPSETILFETVLETDVKKNSSFTKLDKKETPYASPALPSAQKASSEPQIHTKNKAKTISKTPFSRIQPTLFDRWVNQGIGWSKRYFTEGNLIVRVGILVLFIGVAFLLKYASNNSMLPIELRVAGVALAGIAVLITGWRLRHKKNDYALVLQGGGIGILYLTAFAALKLFQLLPSGFVFLCLLLMVVLSATLAILQNSRALAVLATSGGFLAPVLSSTGDGNHIALFSYYAVLNLGVLAIAWFRSWRLLNVLGFGFTFVIGLMWGVKSYEPYMFASAESFLILFFLFYVAIALLFAQRQTPNLRGYVDGTLVFGVPVVAFSIQATIVKDIPFALAFSALFLGFFYLSLAAIYQKGIGRYIPNLKLKLLSESFLALGVIFASLTIPFALDGEWIASAWALEGAGILWISVKQNRKYGILFGLGLQVLGGFGFLGQTNGLTEWPVLNSIWIGASLVAVTGLFSSYYIKTHGAKFFTFLPELSTPFLIWGLLWWSANGLLEINTFVSQYNQLAITLIFFSFTAVSLLFLEHRFKWNELAYNAIGLAIVMLGSFLYAEPQLIFEAHLLPLQQIPASSLHPFVNFGWIAWPIAFASLLTILWYRDKSKLPIHSSITRTIPALHLGALWLFTIIIVIECVWMVNTALKLSNAWLTAAFSLPALVIVNNVMRVKFWPITAHSNTYKHHGALILVLYLVIWSLLANVTGNGSTTPLPYIPLFNPLDMLQITGLITIFYWWTNYGKQLLLNVSSLHVYIALTLQGFLAFNASLIRILNHWFDVPYTLLALMNSNLTQAVLSIVWTLLGLIAMIVASKKYWREAWIAAATLLGLTVTKLLLLDLADREALITIISFIVVGILLLVVGYFSPIPPKEKFDNKNPD